MGGRVQRRENSADEVSSKRPVGEELGEREVVDNGLVDLLFSPLSLVAGSWAVSGTRRRMGRA